MEDVLFHSTLISDIIDHSKFMDMDFVYKAFMSWHGLVAIVVVAAVVVCLFFACFFLLSDQQCQAVVICPDHHGGLGKQPLKKYAIWTFFMSMQALQCKLFQQKLNSLTMVEWLCNRAQQSDYTSISVIIHFNNSTDTQVVLHQWVSFGTGGCVEEV